ncbi:MAG: DUF1566 domain-containing protein [bacterium]
MHTVKSLFITPHKAPKRDIINRFAAKTLHCEEVVIDRTTGLMWQQSASPQPVVYRMAMTLIQDLNKRGFAGFKDWRLPTLEEAMTLMEQSPNSAGLYIDPIFNTRQRLWMWTSERGKEDLVWYVNFNYGYSQLNRIKFSHNYVRAVRLRR